MRSLYYVYQVQLPYLPHPSFNNMTLVSNDPSWWPTINANLIFSYFVVASCTGVLYDWGLMFGKEVELVWRKRWSLMTVLYLIARCVAIVHVVMYIFVNVPTISTTDAG
ncbi:uncharacterized protein EDB93DRAFT_353553 [Suillus bovinus]|uniref:uncharacterized protein n=1 Tax=Suillus bovinus TaxID=48563 RepID=UPI001B8605D5|nr:uncharacterized protein EDB93DRAFT_353553 [Suillus bovinus]KAG2149013.1 hypothetical protein EDB93DRAFT_353553 [Suillus bovinus]